MGVWSRRVKLQRKQTRLVDSQKASLKLAEEQVESMSKQVEEEKVEE